VRPVSQPFVARAGDSKRPLTSHCDPHLGDSTHPYKFTRDGRFGSLPCCFHLPALHAIILFQAKRSSPSFHLLFPFRWLRRSTSSLPAIHGPFPPSPTRTWRRWWTSVCLAPAPTARSQSGMRRATSKRQLRSRAMW
jgi:hypothetical protein